MNVLIKRLIASAVSGALVVLTPGSSGYDACAQVFRAGGKAGKTGFHGPADASAAYGPSSAVPVNGKIGNDVGALNVTYSVQPALGAESVAASIGAGSIPNLYSPSLAAVVPPTSTRDASPQAARQGEYAAYAHYAGSAETAMRDQTAKTDGSMLTRVFTFVESLHRGEASDIPGQEAIATLYEGSRSSDPAAQVAARRESPPFQAHAYPASASDRVHPSAERSQQQAQTPNIKGPSLNGASISHAAADAGVFRKQVSGPLRVKNDKVRLTAGTVPYYMNAMMRGCLVLALLLSASLFTSCTNRQQEQNNAKNVQGDYVWWEAEKPVKSNFPHAGGGLGAKTFDKEARSLLSGGNWLSSTGNRGKDELFAQYSINITADGEYNFWVRKFWKHGPFKWRFDDQGEWRVCGRDIGLADTVYLRQYTGVNWVYVDKVKLAKGPHRFEIRLLAGPGQDTVSAFDCFLLIPGPFRPNGQWKPGQQPSADPGYFVFNPQADHFGKEAVLDLRSLNEEKAGEKGFIRREGDRFVLGDGTPARFWGVNVSQENLGQGRESLDYLARKLAKDGVNMVRFLDNLLDGGPAPLQVNGKALDNLFYLVSALKRQGIYTTLSFYYPIRLPMKPGYGVEGYSDGQVPFGTMYYDERLQEIYKGLAKTLLTTVNPYTGLTLAQDSAVAIVEVVNEDSLFFWSFVKQNVPPAQWRKLEELFGKWLAKRYGSLDKAFAAWGDARLPEDSASEGRAGIYEPWHLTTGGVKQGPPSKIKRANDQVRFFAELQRGFYSSMADYFKKDLKVGGLIAAGNWMVSDSALLDGVERYTYAATDAMDQHGYIGGEGGQVSYLVQPGDQVKDVAAVQEPDKLPLKFFQAAGYPQSLSEIGWSNPNRYRADAAFMTSAYAALQGAGSVDFFDVESNFLLDSVVAKNTVDSPVVAGAFPANALQYRLGYVREAGTVYHDAASPLDAYAQRASASSIPQPDPYSYYVGRVMRGFDVPAKPSAANAGSSGLPSLMANMLLTAAQKAAAPVDPAPFIDRSNKTIKSMTGEINWKYGEGLVSVNTPRSQGAAGFLSRAGEISLGDVRIKSDNEYGSVSVVSLDGQPLSQSRKILVQDVTEEQLLGYKVKGGRIANMGGPPFEVKKIDTTIEIKFADSRPVEVIALDGNGYPVGKPLAVQSGGSGSTVRIKLAPDAIYDFISRK